jgi:predicted glycosyltransferase
MVVAARLLRIPVITMYDYEFTETRIFNTFSERVLVPDGIDDDVLDEIGLSPTKKHKYPGLKEELYIRGWVPNADFRAELSIAAVRQIPHESILVLLRPPASTANYHDARSDSIFAALLQHLNHAGVFTIIVPRTKEQAREIQNRLPSITHAEQRFTILRSAVNGLDLINAADVVISGGGTMNREAVLLGIPVYSIFQGEQGSLDRKMERSGEIVFIRTETDLAEVRLERRPDTTQHRELSDRVEQFVRKHIDFFVASNR